MAWIAPKIEWITQEAPHVFGAPEPSIVVRDPNGTSPLDLIRQGTVDAAIFGNDLPNEPWAKPIIANPDKAGEISMQETGIVRSIIFLPCRDHFLNSGRVM